MNNAYYQLSISIFFHSTMLLRIVNFEKNMKLLALLLYALINTKIAVLAIDVTEMDLQKWNSYKEQFNKKYETADEDNEKMKAYLYNLNKTGEHNTKFSTGEESYETAENHFSDLSPEEFAEKYLSKPPEHVSPKPTSVFGVSKIEVSDDDDPHFIKSLTEYYGPPLREKNWVHEKAMTNVKNQDLCGCCWAFSIAALIESHVFIHAKKKQSLSAQNLLDCVRDRYGFNNTCQGGRMIDALQYVIDNKGIDTEDSYPYENKQGDECKYNADKKGATIKDFKRIQRKNEELLRDVVAHIGPVACGFTVGIYDTFRFYKSGIFFSDKCEQTVESINHSLVIVGYGSEGRLDYWLAKNSWGPEWGDKGYVKIARGPNTCGIAMDTFYPVL